MYDVEKIENFIAHNLTDFIKAIAMPLVVISYLFMMDYRLALISFVPLVFFYRLFFLSNEQTQIQKSDAAVQRQHGRDGRHLLRGTVGLYQ